MAMHPTAHRSAASHSLPLAVPARIGCPDIHSTPARPAVSPIAIQARGKRPARRSSGDAAPGHYSSMSAAPGKVLYRQLFRLLHQLPR
jgi:hypothetical protein